MIKSFYFLILFFFLPAAYAQMNHANHLHKNAMGEMQMQLYQHSSKDSVDVCSYQKMMRSKDLMVQYQNKTYYFCSLKNFKLFSSNPNFYASKLKTFQVAASQFKFSPSELIVDQGDIVQIILTSADVAHGFYLKQFKINVPIKKGEKKVVEFIADKKGTFPFICSIYCGIGHHEMKGVFKVQ